MKLYLVYGDTWFGGYGADINIFGVFDTLERAELVKVQTEEKYFKEDQESRFPELDNRSDVEYLCFRLQRTGRHGGGWLIRIYNGGVLIKDSFIFQRG